MYSLNSSSFEWIFCSFDVYGEASKEVISLKVGKTFSDFIFFNNGVYWFWLYVFGFEDYFKILYGACLEIEGLGFMLFVLLWSWPLQQFWWYFLLFFDSSFKLLLKFILYFALYIFISF
jgi:hypothetical protein